MPAIRTSTGPVLGTYVYLDQIAAILGTTKMSFYPLLVGSTGATAVGEEQYTYGASAGGTQLYYAHNAGLVGSDVMAPVQHNGIYSYACTPINNQYHLVAGTGGAAADHTTHSFGNGTTDSAFSLGLWVMMREAVGTARTLIAKYRTTVATAREYDFRFSTTGYPILELYDESAAASWTATATTPVITPFIWQFVVATYSGTPGTGAITLYVNASGQTPTAVQAGVYVAMEDLTTPLMIGGRDLTTAVAQILNGRVALPFITSKQLTAGDVSSLFSIGKILLGL